MHELHPDTVVHPVQEGWPDREERLHPCSVAFPDSLISRLDALVERDACEADSRSEAVRLACRAWIEKQETAMQAEPGTRHQYGRNDTAPARR
jgi:Arc/MetJ-type ribon-helix-helix transcriptional regulator